MYVTRSDQGKFIKSLNERRGKPFEKPKIFVPRTPRGGAHATWGQLGGQPSKAEKWPIIFADRSYVALIS